MGERPKVGPVVPSASGAYAYDASSDSSERSLIWIRGAAVGLEEDLSSFVLPYKGLEWKILRTVNNWWTNTPTHTYTHTETHTHLLLLTGDFFHSLHVKPSKILHGRLKKRGILEIH